MNANSVPGLSVWFMPIIPILPLLACIFVYGSFLLILKATVACHGPSQDNAESDEKYLPNVSIIIPAHNEERIIEAKIQNTLGLEYPEERIEAIIVDDGSTDGTRDIANRYVDGTHLRLFSRHSRGGYNSATKQGLHCARGDVVVLSGAEVLYERDAVAKLCDHFRFAGIGAVTGRQVILNDNETFATCMERDYRELQHFLSKAESMLDQPFDVKGEIVAVRRAILTSAFERMGATTRGSIDCCVACETRAQGLRLVYEPTAIYSEYVPSTLRERFQMQTQRSKILIESTLMYLWMVWAPKYGKFGMIILPYHLSLLVLVPWIFFAGLGCLAVVTLSNPFYLAVLMPFAAAMFHRRGRVLLSSYVLAQLSLAMGACLIAARPKPYAPDKVESTRRSTRLGLP